MFLQSFFLVALALPLTRAHIFDGRFSDWVQKFSIRVSDDNHREHLFSNWLENEKYIEEMNGHNLTYTLGHNHFSGMNDKEFSNYIHLNNGYLGKIDMDKVKHTVDEVKCLSNCVKAKLYAIEALSSVSNEPK